MEQKKKTWTDYRKEEAILSNKIIAKKLYASNQDKTMMYNELYREKDLEFVISKVKFLREEPAFVPILEKLAEKHGMTYYDTAFMMFCSFRAMQDPFESLTSIRIADHFHPYLKCFLICRLRKFCAKCTTGLSIFQMQLPEKLKKIISTK